MKNREIVDIVLRKYCGVSLETCNPGTNGFYSTIPLSWGNGSRGCSFNMLIEIINFYGIEKLVEKEALKHEKLESDNK